MKSFLELLRDKEINAAWETAKYAGANIVPNITERYLIFRHTVNIFDPEVSNNFIGLYKKNLKGLRLDQDSTFRLTKSPSVISRLKAEAVSPSLETKRKSPVFDVLKNFKNTGGTDAF